MWPSYWLHRHIYIYIHICTYMYVKHIAASLCCWRGNATTWPPCRLSPWQNLVTIFQIFFFLIALEQAERSPHELRNPNQINTNDYRKKKSKDLRIVVFNFKFVHLQTVDSALLCMYAQMFVLPIPRSCDPSSFSTRNSTQGHAPYLADKHLVEETVKVTSDIRQGFIWKTALIWIRTLMKKLLLKYNWSRVCKPTRIYLSSRL